MRSEEKRYNEQSNYDDLVPTPTERVSSESSRNKYGILHGADRIRIREKPSLDSRIEVLMDKGSRVRILSDTQPKFYKVEIVDGNKSVDGYVLKECCHPCETESE